MRLFPLPLSRPRRALRGLRIWSLRFVWHLGFGAWRFLHRPASKFDTAPVLIISLVGDLSLFRISDFQFRDFIWQLRLGASPIMR